MASYILFSYMVNILHMLYIYTFFFFFLEQKIFSKSKCQVSNFFTKKIMFEINWNGVLSFE